MLSAFLEEHGEDVECDLQRWFQLNLVEDIGTPALTWRRLGLFVDRLCRTPDSYLCLSQVKPEEQPWMDLNNQLLAAVHDQLSVSNFLQGQGLVVRGAYKKNPVPEPKPLQRPGITDTQAPKKGRGLKAIIRSIDPVGAAKAGI